MWMLSGGLRVLRLWGLGFSDWVEGLGLRVWGYQAAVPMEPGIWEVWGREGVPIEYHGDSHGFEQRSENMFNNDSGQGSELVGIYGLE